MNIKSYINEVVFSAVVNMSLSELMHKRLKFFRRPYPSQTFIYRPHYTECMWPQDGAVFHVILSQLLER